MVYVLLVVFGIVIGTGGTGSDSLPSKLLIEQNEVSILPHTVILVDSSGTLDVVNVLESETRFRALTPPEPNFSYTSNSIWLRFSVFNQSDEFASLIYENTYDYIQYLDVYIIHNGEITQHYKSGFGYPFSQRTLAFRKNAFPISVNPMDSVVVYVNGRSSASMSLMGTVTPSENYFIRDVNRNYMMGLFYGAVIIMGLYNLFLFFSVRDLSYLFYSAYAFSFMVYQMGIDGYSIMYLWPHDWIWHEGAVPISVAIMLLFGSLFSRYFLNTKEVAPISDKILIGFAILMFVYATVAAMYPSVYINVLTLYSGHTFAAVVLIAGISAYLKGHKQAIYYLIAVSFFVVGILGRTLRLLGYLPESFITYNSMQMGMLLELGVLSFALGNRINQLKAEKEVEKAKIRNKIARDLHDEVGSNLSSIVVSCQILQNESGVNDDNRKYVNEINSTAMTTAQTLRDVVWLINPENDRLDDLIMKMKDVANGLLKELKYDFKSDSVKKTESIDPDVRKHILMIFRESLHNIVKHSQARSVRIRIGTKNGILSLFVSDDGIGYDSSAIKHSGMGLDNIRSRAEAIRASLKIDSNPGRGTTLELSAKLTRENAILED